MSGDPGQRLARGEILIADGAMGTLLQAKGLEPGSSPEALNLSRPNLPQEVAAAYAEAGSDLVHTNSFGGSPLKLADHGLADQAMQINRAAAEAAVRGAAGRAAVSGSIGPCGKLLQPYGEADPQEVADGFLLQARALLAGGAQALTVETMSDLAEAELAVRAAAAAVRESGRAAPVLASMTFDPVPAGWMTIMGNDIESVAGTLAAAGADVLGGNCGQGSAGLLEVARAFGAVTDLPLLIQANAGIPELRAAEVFYPESPTDMAALVPEMIAAGVRVLGGCCGTTPEHIRALRRAVDEHRTSA